MDLDDLTGMILKAAFKVHSELGPGLFESVYETALELELTRIGLSVDRQVGLPVIYDTIKLEVGYRADIIVEKKVLIEIKSVEAIAPVHKKQVITYLRLGNLKAGLLINFNVEHLKQGISRLFNNYAR